MAATFTDHFALLLRLSLDTPIAIHGRGCWRMNTSLLSDPAFQQLIQTHWRKWQSHKTYYPTAVHWWERYVKRMLRQLFQRAWTECKRDRENLENFYYEAIYTNLSDTVDHATRATTLKHLKAKITRLHHFEQQRVFLDNEERDVIEGEQPSLYHNIRAKTRRETRIVSDIEDGTGATYTTTTSILRTFADSLRKRYESVPADDGSVRVLTKNINKTLPHEANVALDSPITIDELQHAVKKGKSHKASGSDGVSQDFFKVTWDLIKHDKLTIVNQMYTEGKMTDKEKHGTIVCIP